MAKYHVSSGDMDRIIEATTPVDAAATAVRLEHESEKPASLSTIIEVIEIADSPWVFEAETICRAVGIWRFHPPDKK